MPISKEEACQACQALAREREAAESLERCGAQQCEDPTNPAGRGFLVKPSELPLENMRNHNIP